VTEPAYPKFSEQVVPRDDDFDIHFDGMILATAHVCPDGDKWVECDLFVTRAGSFVVATRFGSNTRKTSRHIAAVADDEKTAVDWMRAPNGRLGMAAKEVIRKAHALHPALWRLEPYLVVR
jgi:hypothetical protein